jgi:hypothetical protein
MAGEPWCFYIYTPDLPCWYSTHTPEGTLVVSNQGCNSNLFPIGRPVWTSPAPRSPGGGQLLSGRKYRERKRDAKQSPSGPITGWDAGSDPRLERDKRHKTNTASPRCAENPSQSNSTIPTGRKRWDGERSSSVAVWGKTTRPRLVFTQENVDGRQAPQ